MKLFVTFGVIHLSSGHPLLKAVLMSDHLICLTLHSFHIGGCELQLINLCKSLREQGIEVILVHSISKQGLPFPSIPGVKSFFIPHFIYKLRLIPIYLFFLFYIKLHRFPSVFHCHSICYFTEQILWFAQKKNIPTIVKITMQGHIHSLKNQIQNRLPFFLFLQSLAGKHSYRRKREILEAFLFGKNRFATYSKVDAYLSINPMIAEELKEFPIDSKKIVPILNAVDPKQFHPISQEEKIRLKIDLGLPPDRFLIAMVGRFVKRKRFSDLISAWANIEERFPGHLLLLVGDGPEKKECERLVLSLGLEKRVLFTGMRRDIQKYFQAIDLFVFTSECEGLPNVLLEAMSSALPIVATAISGIKEIIGSSEYGLLFAPGDIESLSRSICDLLLHTGKAKQMGVAAREKVLRMYSFEKTTSQFIALYQNLARGL